MLLQYVCWQVDGSMAVRCRTASDPATAVSMYCADIDNRRSFINHRWCSKWPGKGQGSSAAQPTPTSSPHVFERVSLVFQAGAGAKLAIGRLGGQLYTVPAVGRNVPDRICQSQYITSQRVQLIATAECQAGSRCNGVASSLSWRGLHIQCVSTAKLVGGCCCCSCVGPLSRYQRYCSVHSLGPVATPVDIVAECTRVALTCAWTDSTDGLGINPTTCSQNACAAIYHCTRHARTPWCGRLLQQSR